MHYSIWHIISSPILHIQFGLKLINERWRAMKPGAYCGLVILTILLMDALLCFNYQTSGQMHANLIPSPNKQINKINGRMAIYQRQESKEGKKPAQLHRINRTSFTDVVSYLSQKNHTEKKKNIYRWSNRAASPRSWRTPQLPGSAAPAPPGTSQACCSKPPAAASRSRRLVFSQQHHLDRSIACCDELNWSICQRLKARQTMNWSSSGSGCVGLCRRWLAPGCASSFAAMAESLSDTSGGAPTYNRRQIIEPTTCNFYLYI